MEEYTPKPVQFKQEVFISEGDTLLYNIAKPDSYQKKLPLLVFLHGAGERGNNNKSQLKHGGQFLLKSQAQFPSIMIFPQCPKDDYWARVDPQHLDEHGNRDFPYDMNKPMNKPLSLVEQLIEQYAMDGSVDTNRIYIAGLSMGGMGTLELLAVKPDYFAGAIAICGVAPMSKVEHISKTPLWLFHGAKDNVVDVKNSEKLAAELLGIKAPVRLTVYADLGHNSWDRAFKEREFLSWLFQQEKPQAN